MPLKMQKPNHRDATKAFLLNKRIGNKAASLSLVSQNKNKTKEIKKMTNSAIMLPFP